MVNILKAYVLQEQGSLLEIVDPILGTNYSKQEVISTLNIALLCSSQSASLRPAMSAVVSMLEGKRKVEPPNIKRTTTNNNMISKGFEKITTESQTQSSTFSQESLGARTGSSMDAPWFDSTISIPSKDTSKTVKDLYDVNLE